MNQAFSKIWIIIIIIVIFAIGIFSWQYFGMPKEIPKEIPKEVMEGDIISMTFTSENWAWGHTFDQIEISGNGDFNYTRELEDKVQEKFDGKLSETELEELSKLILYENFFSLPEDFGPARCADAPIENLKITMKTLKGKITHEVKANGGSLCVQNESYQKITGKIEELVKK